MTAVTRQERSNRKTAFIALAIALGMLGLGALRTVEKWQGVAR